MHERVRLAVTQNPGLYVVLAACLALSCRDGSAPVPGRASANVRRVAGAGAPSVAKPVELALPSAPARLPARVAETVDAGLYRFRVEQTRRCAGQKPLISATLHVNSKQHDLFVAPRDVSLEKDGVIFASLPTDKAPRGCGAPLEPVQLRPNGNATGAVYFELPSDVSPRGAKLVFKPTRWGGAPPVTVDLPEQI